MIISCGYMAGNPSVKARFHTALGAILRQIMPQNKSKNAAAS